VRKLRRLRRKESQASSLTSASGADREVSVMESELQNLQVTADYLLRSVKIDLPATFLLYIGFSITAPDAELKTAKVGL